jgi:hypothetical protein
MAESVSQNQKVGADGTAVEPLQLATLTAKRQRSEATPLRHAVKARGLLFLVQAP